MFLITFFTIFLAILKIALIAGAAFALVKKRYLSQADITSVSRSVVYFFLPCLIFSKITEGFNPGELHYWWQFPLSALLIFLMGFTSLIILFRGLPEARELIPLSLLQNAGYFVLPLGKAIFPDQFTTFAVYTFLFIMAQSPILWTVGPLCISSRKDGQDRGWKRILNPPFITICVSLAVAFAGLGPRIPDVIAITTRTAGDAAVPMSVFILGGGLGALKFVRPKNLKGLCLSSANKLLIIPLLVIPFIAVSGYCRSDPLFETLLILQACTPPAVGLMIQVKNYGGNQELVSTGLLISYLLSLITIPFFLSVWEVWPG